MPEEEMLYVVSIGVITNIASAIILEPSIIKKIVVVWLGGNSMAWLHNYEFNCMQDKKAARIVFNLGAPLLNFFAWG